MTRARLLLLALAIASASPVAAQSTSIVARTSDVNTIENLITALYAAISGPVGQPREWDRFHTLFHADARLVPTRCPTAGPCSLRVMTPAQYRQNADSFLVNSGFTEAEITHRIERYGSVAHVFSSYESFRLGETVPFSRGINSIQLFWDGSRWWVLQIFWDSERPNNPLPADFSTKPK